MFAGVKQLTTYKAHTTFDGWVNTLGRNEEKGMMVTFNVGKDDGQKSQSVPFYLCICVSVCGALGVTSCHCRTNSVIFLSGHQLSHKYL